jgi:hypothetical protein
MPLKLTSVLLALSLAAIVWLTTALVRVENQRYAIVVGMCPTKADTRLPPHVQSLINAELPPDLDCLAKVQTRTSWMGHVLYALTD